MTLASFEVKFCPRCQGERPHSKAGKCMALHRATDLHRGKPLANRGQLSPEVRFKMATKWGPPPEYRPDLGPCLLFTGADNGNGYGQFRYDGRNGYAHRYAWERANGPIPDDLTVDHLCRVRNCCNVAHMELVDAVTNFRRGVRARTHCKRGHEYPPGESKVCLTCQAAERRRNWLKRARWANGLPNRTIKYDQNLVREVISKIRAGEMRIADGARQVGCHPNYLGRRVWQETRAAVLARDGACLRCGTSSVPLQAHHRRPRGSGGSSDPKTSFGMANLATVCSGCHLFVEQWREEAKAQGWLITRFGDVDPASVPILTVRGWELLAGDGTRRGVEP